MHRRNWIKSTGVAGLGTLLAQNPLFGKTMSSPQPMNIRPKWGEKTSPLRHSWAGLGNIDQTRWIIRRDMQEQLAMCHRELGLKHLRAVGIFDDEMWVYDKDPANYLNAKKRANRRINWRVPYTIYDALVGMGISPVVTTCFTPEGMKTGTETCFDTKAHITPPKDWKQWEGFITEFVKGLVDRYGIEVVRHWYFEVWNEPNLTGFWTGGMEGFLKMHQIVHGAVKSVDASLKVGGPSTAHTVWLRELLDFGAKNHCMPDFIIGHIYNNDSAGGDPLSPFDGPQGDKENHSPNFISGIVRGARKLLDEASFKGEFHMNEWGLSWHPFAPVRETANEAAFIVKTMNEVSQLADYFAYWCLSDIYNQVGYGREAFHGNYGMLSFDGLRKPNYFAHQLLNQLANQRVMCEPSTNENHGAMVTRNGKDIRAIVYAFDITYAAGDHPGSAQIDFLLPPDVDPSSVRMIRLDSKENNVISAWKNMGAPAYLKPKERDFLLAGNTLQPSSKFETRKDEQGTHLLFSMETPGVSYLEASTIKS